MKNNLDFSRPKYFKERVTPKKRGISFVNANKNLALRLVTHQSLSLKCRFSLRNSFPKKPKFDLVAAILDSHIVLNQTCSNSENDSTEDSEVDNRLKKKKSDLVRDANSVAGFCPLRYWISSRRNDVTQTQPGFRIQFQNGRLQVASFETNFFIIAGTSEDGTSVSGKAALGEVRFLELRSPLR